MFSKNQNSLKLKKSIIRRPSLSKPKKRLILRNVCYRLVLTQASTNYFVSLTKPNGQIVDTKSCGSIGFKGSACSNYIALMTLWQSFLANVAQLKITQLVLVLKNVLRYRRKLISVLKDLQVPIIGIRFEYIMPHNGCRFKKQRRKKNKKR